MDNLNNKCEYIKTKGEEQGKRCDINVKGQRRRFCGKHHKYMSWWLIKDFDDNLLNIKESFINGQLYKNDF